eukprot:gene18518-17046_t
MSMPTTKPWAQVHLARMQWSPEAMMDRATSEQSPEVATAAQSPSAPPPAPPPAAALIRLPASALLASGVVFNLAFLFRPWTSTKLTPSASGPL